MLTAFPKHEHPMELGKVAPASLRYMQKKLP
jgi:hypothetical protein